MSPSGLVFLGCVIVLWLIVWPVRGVLARQMVFLAASLFFYASWGFAFPIILLCCAGFNLAWGEHLRRRPQRGWLWLGVALNLAVLGAFKYLPLRGIVMPVGISFWIFQAIGYLADAYKGRAIRPTLVEFCLYLAFWPTVLSGPLTRAQALIPQFRQAIIPTWQDVTAGTRRVLTGLFMKVVLAQVIATGLRPGEGVSDGLQKIIGGATPLSGLDVWFLAVGFGLQLYFDFAGYSHIMIGAARLFGFRLPENFARPYLSTSPAEFWQRWHKSLSGWIRDYIFYPLARRRGGLVWYSLSVILAMILFGLWHAARPALLLWGLYQGFLVVAAHWLRELRLRPTGWVSIRERLVSWAATYALISFGWVFFFPASLAGSGVLFGKLLDLGGYFHRELSSNYYLLTALLAGGTLAVEFLSAHLPRWAWLQRAGWLFAPLVYTGMIVLILAWLDEPVGFIYMQY